MEDQVIEIRRSKHNPKHFELLDIEENKVIGLFYEYEVAAIVKTIIESLNLIKDKMENIPDESTVK